MASVGEGDAEEQLKKWSGLNLLALLDMLAAAGRGSAAAPAAVPAAAPVWHAGAAPGAILRCCCTSG